MSILVVNTSHQDRRIAHPMGNMRHPDPRMAERMATMRHPEFRMPDPVANMSHPHPHVANPMLSMSHRNLRIARRMFHTSDHIRRSPKALFTRERQRRAHKRQCGAGFQPASLSLHPIPSPSDEKDIARVKHQTPHNRFNPDP